MDKIITIIEKNTAGQDWQKLHEARAKIANPSVPVACLTERRSEVDITRKVRENYWIVSLARKPDAKNALHAFIIIEGIQGGNAVLWFMDFISKSGIYTQAGFHAGRIRIRPYSKPMTEYLSAPYESRLIFSSTSEMLTLHPNEYLLATSWEVPSEHVIQLINSVKQKIDAKDYPKFTIVGHDSVFGQSSAASQSEEEAGHNCFSWAKSILRELDEVKFSGKLNYSDIREWISEATSYLLKDTRPLAVANQRYKIVTLLSILFAMGPIWYAWNV